MLKYSSLNVGVVVSFLCAVFNRLFGARLFYVTLILLLLFVGAWYYLDGHNHENWALLAIALSGCVVGGGVNYHFPVGSPPAGVEKKCDPSSTGKQTDCPRPAEKAR